MAREVERDLTLLHDSHCNCGPYGGGDNCISTRKVVLISIYSTLAAARREALEEAIAVTERAIRGIGPLCTDAEIELINEAIKRSVRAIRALASKKPEKVSGEEESRDGKNR